MDDGAAIDDDTTDTSAPCGPADQTERTVHSGCADQGWTYNLFETLV